ncbi:recombination protein RecT [Thiohalorhabdus sp.]|uniref:recombination protein RecT n=1 Tax=Thiohalorhabdus sp. TaxID=3094134 RepID=UPI002FC39EA3
MANQPQKTQKSPAKTVWDMMSKHQGQIKAALPKGLESERLVRIAMTEIRSNPKLLECEPKSLFGAVIQSAQLGLEPGIMGEAYLIPFRNKGQMEVQFIPGYKGLLKLARRSGQVKKIETGVVRENDVFEVEYGTSEKLRHIPAQQDRGGIQAVYALAKLRDDEGGEPEVQFEVMSLDEIEEVRSTSKASQSGPWVDWWEQMARKTVAKRLIKWLPTSVEAQEAVALDERADAGVSQGNTSVIEGEYQAASQGGGSEEPPTMTQPGEDTPPVEPEPVQTASEPAAGGEPEATQAGGEPEPAQAESDDGLPAFGED